MGSNLKRHEKRREARLVKQTERDKRRRGASEGPTETSQGWLLFIVFVLCFFFVVYVAFGRGVEIGAQFEFD